MFEFFNNQKDFKWQGFSSDEIRLHLQSGTIMTFTSGEEFKMGYQVADCFLVDGAVIHQGEIIESPNIIHHIELDKSFSDGHDVQESVCVIPERAVLLVVKRKRENGIAGPVNNRTSMTSQISKVRSRHEPSGRMEENFTRASRTSFNTVKVDTARREYMASKLTAKGRFERSLIFSLFSEKSRIAQPLTKGVPGRGAAPAPEALMEMTEEQFNATVSNDSFSSEKNRF